MGCQDFLRRAFSLQLVVTTYMCGRARDSGEEYHHGGTTERGDEEYGAHETTSEYAREVTEPGHTAGGDYAGEDPRHVPAPDDSEYDEFYEGHQGKQDTTDKIFMIPEDESGATEERSAAPPRPRSLIGASSPPDNEATPGLSSQSYIPIGYRDSNGTTSERINFRETFTKRSRDRAHSR